MGFIKSKPNPYPTSAPLSSTEFDTLVAMPKHKDFTQQIVDYLLTAVEVPVTSLLLYSISLRDCGPQWQSL